MNRMSIELEKYKGKDSRHQCPACNDKSSFVYYIDTETKIPIHRTCGKCNRESGCGYHYTPKQYFIDNPKEKIERKDWTPPAPRKLEPPRPMGNLSFDLVERSNSTDSNFVRFLIDLLNDNSKVVQLCQLYKIGATKAKEVIFWQVDESNKVRTGKVMQYDPATGKRSKTQTTDWIHSRMQKAKLLTADYNLKQCFFGQHLLTDKTKTIAVVESEKTAIICSGLMPDFIWIAAGQLQGLNIDKSSCLAGRKVIFFPDLSKDGKTFDIWKAKATEIMEKYSCKIIVSDLLERNATATEREKGLDIADYLINEQQKKLQQPIIAESEPITEPEPIETPLPKPKQYARARGSEDENKDIVCPFDIVKEPPSEKREDETKHFFCAPTLSKREYRPQPKQNWSVEISEIEKYFAAVELPSQLLRLNECSTIINVRLFIDSHISTVKANNGVNVFLPHLNRLQTLKQILANNKNLQKYGTEKRTM